MTAKRFFLAIALPEAHRQLLSGLRTPGKGFAWTRTDQMHLTLRYLGEAEEEVIEKLVAALGHIAVTSFSLPLEGLGAFPPRGRPRVVWAGVGSGHPRLFQLRQRIDDTLLSLRFETDLRQFHPHVTICRIREEASPQSVLEFLKQRRAFEGPPFRVTEFALYASQHSPSGVEYSVEARFPLLAD